MGQILGRNRSSRRHGSTSTSTSTSTNTSSSLGLTQTNAAAIPRHACWVRSMMTMRKDGGDDDGGTILLERCGGTSSSSSSCLYYQRAGTTQRIKWDNHVQHHHLTLKVGDSLCFRNKPKPSKTESSSSAANTVWHEFIVSRLVEDNHEDDATTTATPPPRHRFTRNHYPLHDGTPFVMNPYLHHYDWVAAVPSSPSMTTQSPSSSTQEAVVTVESPSSSSSCHQDEDVVKMDEDDEDLEYDSEDDPEKDYLDNNNNKTTMMHMTLANTYGKALLESRTPTMGLHLLDLVATPTNTSSSSSGRLPTLPLVQDLVQVLTYGPTQSKAAKDPRRLPLDHHHDNNDNDNDEDIRSCKYRKTMGRPYWDETRMASAHTYLSSLWERYPQEIPRLFVQALPPHYFDTILVDQIVSLVYTDQKTSTTTNTDDDAVLNSLQLQIYALGFAERLVSSQDSAFLSYLHDYNENVGSSRQVGNLAAKALALILVRYGSDHWTSTATSSSSSKVVFVVLYELVGILGRLTQQTILLEKKSRPLSETVEILYNAWESAWQDHYHDKTMTTTTTTSQKKKHKGSLTQTWIESFLKTDDEDSSSLARALAKRCRLTQVIFPSK